MSQQFTNAQIALAASNYEAQEWLTRELRKAFQMTRMSVSELSDELELTLDETNAWLNGEIDFSMSELRQLANALDAFVTYKVSMLRTKYNERLLEIDQSGLWDNSDQWSNADLLATSR